MTDNLFDAYLKGPDNIKHAKIQIHIACALVVLTVLATAAMYIFSSIYGVDGELGDLLNDPTIPITLLALSVFGFLTFKEHIWASIILLLNQLSDMLVIFMGTSNSFGVLMLMKLFIYIGAIRATIYLRKQKKLNEPVA